MATAYKDMEWELSNKQSFTGNSVSARYNDKGNYCVYSYDTIIYSDNGYFNNKYYSTTTSKIQNILIDIFRLNDGKKKRD